MKYDLLAGPGAPARGRTVGRAEIYKKFNRDADEFGACAAGQKKTDVKTGSGGSRR
jgi:hypothetical protein